MQNPCLALADTGTNVWQVVGIGLCLLLSACLILFFIQRKRGIHYKLGRGSMALVAMLLVANVFIHSGVVKAAAPCNVNTPSPTTGTPSNNTAPVTNPAALELVDDSYDNTNGVYFDPIGGGWYGKFDILANDNPPNGDPIDPTTVKLVGEWPMYEQYGFPEGYGYWILDPSDPTNPPDHDNPADPATPYGQFYLSNTDGDYNSTNGLVSLYLSSSTPFNSTFTVKYTAKTMSGIVATHNATITVKNSGYTTPPPPTLVDNSFNLGTNYANGGSSYAYLGILPNDLPQPDDPLSPSSLSLIDPTNSSLSGGFYETYADLGDTTNSWIRWYVDSGLVKVQFGPAVPNLTPFSIDYTVNSNAGIPPVAPATITVTRDSNLDNITLSGEVELGYDCNTGFLPPADLTAVGSTSIGSLDPLSIDLDPYTAGRQTSANNPELGTITVDNNGIVTYTADSSTEGSFLYTIANTNGDVSNIGLIRIINHTGCG